MPRTRPETVAALASAGDAAVTRMSATLREDELYVATAVIAGEKPPTDLGVKAACKTPPFSLYSPISAFGVEVTVDMKI